MACYHEKYKIFKKIPNYYATKMIEIYESGYYAIEISAYCRNRLQNFTASGLPLDDDLRVRIKGKSFPKLDNRQGFFNTPASFNGTKQKNNLKTNIFIKYFEKGEKFIIEFDGKRTPRLKEIKVYPVQVKDNSIKFDLNIQAKDVNRSAWYTFVLMSIQAKTVSISAKCEKRFLDSDDLKVVIDHQIQYHPKKTRWGKEWYFRGAELKGQTKSAVFSIKPNKKNLNYIEIWADRKPILKEVVFQLASKKRDEEPEDVLRPYQHQDFPKRDYNRYDEVIIKAVNYWNEYFSRQKYPPSEFLDSNLVKAMIVRESQMGYFLSADNFDLMQIGNPADKTLAHMRPDHGYEESASEFVPQELRKTDSQKEYEYDHMSYSYPQDRKEPNADTIKDSIFWGVRWLFHKAQYMPQISKKPLERKWRTWKQAVIKYNSQIKDKFYQQDVYTLYELGVYYQRDINTGEIIKYRLWKKP